VAEQDWTPQISPASRHMVPAPCKAGRSDPFARIG